MLSSLIWLWLAHAGPGVATPPCNQPPKTAAKQTTNTAAKAKKPKSIELGPMLFRIKDGRVKKIEQLSYRELYSVASRMYAQKKYAQSIVLYKRILKYFPMHQHLYAARYNLALSYEDNNQCALALPLYQKVIQSTPKKKQIVLNAKFRLASCHSQLKQWQKAFDLYDKLMQRSLEDEDRIDALAYAGEALFHLKRFAEARPLLELSVAIYARKLAPKQTISYAAAMAQYYRARILDVQFRERPFRLPQSQLKLDFEFKADHMLKALRLYLQTIRLKHADWALASVYRVGEMYEKMYADMMAAPSPKELTKEETQIYFQELRKKIKILLEKALNIYKKGLLLADRIGIKDNNWKTRSKQRYEAVLAFYTKHFGPHKDSKKATSKPTARKTDTTPKTAPKATKPKKADPKAVKTAPKAVKAAPKAPKVRTTTKTKTAPKAAQTTPQKPSSRPAKR